jgi:retron-type reverse transcriptase
MITYNNLWKSLCSYDNLELAFRKARRHKTLKPYVIEFEKNLKDNLLMLRTELLLHSYRPKPLETFIVRDPKTRKISKSDFRDRVVHHALCNIIEPIFEKIFIYDSYANRIGKGTLKALQRFDYFKRKVSRNNTRECYVLKADIKQYFESVNHEVLLGIIRKKIKDDKVILLIKIILQNYKNDDKDKGMPLGNLTSQFFANVYLNELDYFIKNKLFIKSYIRYVDDFVIISENKKELQSYKKSINEFLETLGLELHPDKSKIIGLEKGVGFLGFRIFYYFKLLKNSNLQQFKRKLELFKKQFNGNLKDYDSIYASMEGWLAYTKTANTYGLRHSFIERFEGLFPCQTADVEISRWLKI